MKFIFQKLAIYGGSNMIFTYIVYKYNKNLLNNNMNYIKNFLDFF